MEDAAAAAAEAEATLNASKRRRVDGQQAPPGSGSGQEQDDLIGRRLEVLHDLMGRRVLSRLQDDAASAIRSLLPTSQEQEQEQGSLDDLISRLADDILGTIISLLPTKDGARTQVLSRRWRPLWRSSAPLSLVADWNLVNGDSQKHIAVISKILSDHSGPARCFSLHDIRLPDSLGEIDGWLRSQSLDNLEELEITYTTEYGGTWYPLPPSILRFSPTLRVAEFGSCQFPDLTMAPNFQHLESLTLNSVGIPEDSLHSLLSASTALETLSLHNIFGISRICISSLTIRSLGFFAQWNEEGIISFHELVIQDAPCLERLIPLNPHTGPVTVRVIKAPKLKILGLLSEGISTLHIGTSVFQKMVAVSLTTKMHTMKILVLDSIGPNLDTVVGFLKCFPCLEKLYVISHPQKDMNNMRGYDPLDPIDCLELHLKKVVLKNYNGNKKPVIDFAKFFILNAKVLEEMEIGILNHRNDKWMRYQRRQLQVENRASRGAQIELKSDVNQNFIHHEHTHDFSKPDPFDGPCGRLLQMR